MPILSRRQPYRNAAIKDPSAEVTTEQNLRVRQVVGAQQAAGMARTRRRVGTQDANALLYLLRRNVRVDLPTGAGKILRVGQQQAIYARRLVRRIGTQDANALLYLLRRNVRLDLPKPGPTKAAGTQQAQAMRRRVMRSGYLAFGVLRANSWVAPYDVRTFVGEIALTELSRVIAFIEAARGSFTEDDRVTAFGEAARGSITEIDRIIAFTEDR